MLDKTFPTASTSPRCECSETAPRANHLDAAKSLVSAVCAPYGTALLASSDDYHRVVVVLDAKTRVVAADVQWIIQKRKRSGRSAWESKYFCSSKAGLLRFVPKVPEVLALPDRFPNPTPKRKRSAQQIRRSPALGMLAPVGTARQVQVELNGPLFVKESEDGSFAVAAARTGAIVEDGIESTDKAEGWRDGYEKARPRSTRRGQR
jgi:hypothetical protein